MEPNFSLKAVGGGCSRDRFREPAALVGKGQVVEGHNLGRGVETFLLKLCLLCLAWAPARFWGGSKSSNWMKSKHLGSLVKGDNKMQR